MKGFANFFSLTGKLSYFGLSALASAFAPHYEWRYLFMQIEAMGWQSVPLISAAGVALGVVMTLHTRSTLVVFGAEAEAPHLQSAAFFNKLGPLVTGLLVAGRVGAASVLSSRTCASRNRSTLAKPALSILSSIWSSLG
jgi:phospholipid/cholesterol/gamma-HCH transport system permease protein